MRECHYANTPMQYTAIFHGCKNVHFQMKIFNVFPVFAQNIDCGYTGGSNEYPQSMFWSKTKKTRIDVYETLCPQQMLVHKGGKIKNWGGECRDVTPTKSLSQNIRVDVNREVKFL